MQTPVHASQVYTFLQRNYRVSRHTRALWQFKQIAASSLNRVRIPTSDEIRESTDEIVLLSALDKDNEPIPPSSNIICTSSTRFSYFTRRYKFAFILDMTDSCASVSVDGGHIYLESLTNCLCILLYSLAQTLTLPGCEIRFQPEIDISVYVYFPLYRTPSHQVLIHGYQLSWSTLESVCQEISTNLKNATELLHNIMSINQPFATHSTSLTTDSDDNINSHLNSVYSNNESSCAIINMLSYGITALQLMPEESTAALVIITDGILDVPNLVAFEAVMRQIRARIISCSFVQIGSNDGFRSQTSNSGMVKPPIASLGHVPNDELLKFISSSTFGSFIYFDVDHISGGSTVLKRLFSQDFDCLNVCKKLRRFQNELLSWGFHKAIGDFHPLISKRISSRTEENKSNETTLPISCKLVSQTVLQTALKNVLSLRLREGYTVRDVEIEKDEIKVHLILPWRYDMHIYYRIRSNWPLENSVRTDIRVYKEAPIHFLQELNQLTYNQTTKAVNIGRNNLIRRYNDVIQAVSLTDRHLTLINTFAQNPAYYQVPDTIKRVKSIFYLKQNDLQQTLLKVKDNDFQAFADFWRPIVILDGSLWQRFMFTLNLTILLVNDPLSNSLFLMSNHLSQAHNQHSNVSFRLAKSDFELFLSEYFSFVLLDGQAYIKFLFLDENETVPYSFMLLRIIGQPPLLYLKFAFQTNTKTAERHKLMEDFRYNLINLRPRCRMKSGNVNETNRKQQTSTPVSSSQQRALPPTSISIQQRSNSPCCVILNKNIERLILKPDPFPYDALGIQKPDDEDLQHKIRTELDSKRQALAKFFYIRTFVRSFESINHSSNIPKKIADIILDTFIRRRLQEGFHFAISHNNIHNLILEVKMNTSTDQYSKDILHIDSDKTTRTCLIQYRIYPVECGRSADTSPIREARSMSSRRASNINSDPQSSYYFVSQCWIEPQDGFVETNTSELEYLNHCTYKQIVDKIGEVDRECFNTLVSFYFVKYLQGKNASLPRTVSRAPRALTADISREPFNQDTINLIRRSHQTYFDFSAFIDDYDKIKHDYISNDGKLVLPILNSSLLKVLRKRLCSKAYKNKPQLFPDCDEINHAFTRILLARTVDSRLTPLPLGLRSLKTNRYLIYLLNYNEQRKSQDKLTDLEYYLIGMLFPRWDFLVSPDGDEYIHMVLLPKTERDLFLLNTDLTSLMHDLIGKYTSIHIDNGLPIYDDCRYIIDGLIDEIEVQVGDEGPYLLKPPEQTEPKIPEEQTSRQSRSRRQRRDTFTSADLLSANYRSSTSSPPISIAHSTFQHASSQPTTTIGYRRIYSPLTIDTTNHSLHEPMRRYSASAISSSNQNLNIPPILNLIPPSPQQNFCQETLKTFLDQQWHMPIFLYSCKKISLASTLLMSNEQLSKTISMGEYVDCTKDENDLIRSTVIPTIQNIKSRKRDNSRRHDDEQVVLPDKQIEDMRESLDYAFATAFYENCLRDLTTHRSDVEYALNTIYQEHCEDIDLTSFLKAMCSHLSLDKENLLPLDTVCEPTTKHIDSYLNEKFLEIISKYFHRVSPDSDYFYYCADNQSCRQSRCSLEIEDRPNNPDQISLNSGPYKFDETNRHDHESETDDDHASNGTVQINDDEEESSDLRLNHRQSDDDEDPISNPSRDISLRRDILPLFICFDCRLITKEYDYNTQVKTIPLCISGLINNSNSVKLDQESLHVTFSLMCLTFGREDSDSQDPTISGVSMHTPTLTHNSFLSSKRLQEIDAIENSSTCTGTTVGGGDLNKGPLDKLRLFDAQKRAIIACRREIEWLLRDEQLSTYFTRRTLDRKLIENVIEHVETSVNINKSNCLCRSMDLTFVLGVDKSLKSFLEEIRNIRIRQKYMLIKCGNYYVLLEPMNLQLDKSEEQLISSNSNDDRSSVAMEDSMGSDVSIMDDEEERKSSEDELEDYVKPSFWLFIERKKKTSSQFDLPEMKFYLYCGSSSDTTQTSSEPQEILKELINEFDRLCRTINQKFLLNNLASSRLCNPLLVPPGENDDTSLDADTPILTANLSIQPGTFACDELWTHSFPLHVRLRPHLHPPSTSKSSSSVYHPNSLLRELATHFSALAVHNRKNLFVYCGKKNDYYMRFREDIHPSLTTNLLDESLNLNESQNTLTEPASPQISSISMKNRQRHDSGTFCVHVMLYGLKSAVTDPSFEEITNNLIQSVVTRLEEEVVKELVNALYRYAMTRLNPDDITFIRPIDSEPKHIFEYKISPLINTNVFLYYFRRYIKTNHFHQPLLLPALAKDMKDIIKDYHGQTLIVYNKNYHIRILRPGLAWIELHIINPTNRPSPFSSEEFSDDLTTESLIQLIKIAERKSSDTDLQTENILRCNIWTRGCQTELDPTTMSTTLVQAFTYALVDYVTEYKLLPTLYNNSRHTSFEPPPSPRFINSTKLSDETNKDFYLAQDRTFTLDNTIPTTQSRRHSMTTSTAGLFHMFTRVNKSIAGCSPVKLQRQESVQNSLLSSSSMDEPQSLSVEHADCLTNWFQYLVKEHPKLPSLTSSSHTLTNRILLFDIIHNFTLRLNESKSNPYKHESLHGMVFRCNQERTFYLPVPALDQIPKRIPGENLDLIVLYQSNKMTNDLVIENIEPSPQQDFGDAISLVNSTDIPKQIVLCIFVKDKKLSMVLHNAPDDISKSLINYFTNLINWSNKRLNILNIIVTQKMGLFRYRSFHHDQLSEYNRQHGSTPKHSSKNDNVDLEQLIKENLSPDNPNIYTSWNIDLIYCNLIGSYPMLSEDTNQDLVQRHGKQLLQLKENKKFHTDRCTKLEEMCSNWILKPKLFIADDLLTQMKHRSRLLNISVVSILFSRSARFFFHNDSTLRANNILSLDVPSGNENFLVNRMTNKRKSIAIPADFARRRFLLSDNENDYQIAQTQLIRLDTSRFSNIEQQHIHTLDSFIEQLTSHLQLHHKFHMINTKSIPRKTPRSITVSNPIEHNFHRSDQNRRVTILAELTSLNNSQLVLRFLQYDIIKIPIGNQTSSTTINHYRQISNESSLIIDQSEMDAFVYDFHLQTIIRHQTNSDDTQIFPGDFSLILFLQDFIEYYPTAPIGSKTALFKTIIHHQIEQNTKRSADSYLFKYVLEHASTYNIKIKRRNSEEYLFDSESNDIYWMAARTTPSTSAELTVVMYIIYTNLAPKTGVISTSNKMPIPSANSGVRPIPNSLKSSNTINQMRERTSTLLLPPVKANLVAAVRINSEQLIGDNIPSDRNVEYFKLKLESILTRASLSHRRESLWERLIASRPEHLSGGRQETMSINVTDFQALLDSCTTDDMVELKEIVPLLQRVFSNKEQSERLYKFLRTRYGTQLNTLSSSTTNYLVIYQCKAPQQCDVFLVLIYRTDRNELKSSVVKHRNHVGYSSFIETFKQRISYFLWESLT